MKERPILFSGPMVRAILDGRKAQTRRVVKGFEIERLSSNREFRAASPYPLAEDLGGLQHYVLLTSGLLVGLPCPYGKAGDRLWVRETWGHDRRDGAVIFRADVEERVLNSRGWKPSIHMPRKVCRLMLEVASVRVERLMDITEADARSEGVEADPCCCIAYRRLWDSLNEKRGYGWKVNPWVWVVEFRRCTGDNGEQR